MTPGVRVHLRGKSVARNWALEGVLKRDRTLVLAALAGATALAWVYLVISAVGMDEMPMVMPQVKPWTALDFGLMFLMWVVMMVGMMVPSAAPMILLYAMVSRKQQERGRTFAPTGAFVSGYIVVWTAFSLGATALQWILEQVALLSPMMVSTSPLFGGVLLIGAGIYQWTPLKHACLKRCRSPFDFLMRGWRKGAGGAFVMGVEHGAFCVGCCWVLMGLLFFGGVMNLLCVAAITIFVLIEKMAPLGAMTGRVTGIFLVLVGLYVIVQG